jgi:SecD-like export protein/sigma-70-like protein
LRTSSLPDSTSAYAAWGRVRRAGDPDAYVRAIVIHENSKRFRKQRVREDLCAVVPECGTGADDSLADRAALHDALSRLGPRQRAVIVLRFWLDMSEAATAQALDCSVGTARGEGPLARPVLLESPLGSAKEYGDAHLVNTATLRLFQRLSCTPVSSGLSGAVTNDAWKATVGYTAAQWNAAGSEVASCDASGGKYVLGKAVVLDSQVTSATARHLQNTGQWVVDVTLNSAATAAFAQLTTTQATGYYPASQSNGDDAVLDSTAFVINGDVQSAPVTEAPITIGKLMIAGRVSSGFTEAEAEALAAQLS